LVSNVESGRVSLETCLAGAKSYASLGILNIRLSIETQARQAARELLRVSLALHVRVLTQLMQNFTIATLAESLGSFNKVSYVFRAGSGCSFDLLQPLVTRRELWTTIYGIILRDIRSTGRIYYSPTNKQRLTRAEASNSV